MICPGRYKDMATGTGLSPEKADPGANWGSRPPADRLEAALDACLIDVAEATAASAARVRAMSQTSPIPVLTQCLEGIRPQPVCVFSCRLSYLRAWVGDRYTKQDIAALFHSQVARKYTGVGWADCTVECGAPRANMTFRFEMPNLEGRAADALATLGEILGVKRVGDPGSRESITEYLENLRAAARYMRFDLEAERREKQSMARAANDLGADDEYDDDDGYYPPFEGSPDDDNFGNG